MAAAFIIARRVDDICTAATSICIVLRARGRLGASYAARPTSQCRVLLDPSGRGTCAGAKLEDMRRAMRCVRLLLCAWVGECVYGLAPTRSDPKTRTASESKVARPRARAQSPRRSIVQQVTRAARIHPRQPCAYIHIPAHRTPVSMYASPFTRDAALSSCPHGQPRPSGAS